MKKYLTSPIGRFRVIAFMEGISLLILLFVAMPVKYIWGNPAIVKSVGQIHGILFLLFVFQAIKIGVEQQWSFKNTTWKVLLACIIPFGTFYIDHHILRKMDSQ